MSKKERDFSLGTWEWELSLVSGVFQFASSNPIVASLHLDVLNFITLVQMLITAGGLIITDWYSTDQIINDESNKNY